MQVGPTTDLSDLFSLCIPLGAILLVLDRAKLTKQQEDLRDDDAR